MGAVSGDQNMIAGAKIALIFAIKSKASQTREEEHPFVMPLTMGLIGWRRLTSRDDPFDTHVLLKVSRSASLGFRVAALTRLRSARSI
jgi:hypothetical protein